MHLQSFEAPRMLRDDLGGGVSAGALLLGSGLAALSVGSKGRLLLQPLSGEGGAVVDLALAGIQEIALLSKDIAVALDGERVLWALTDLGTAVKAQKLARDVRALCARPTGESALALGEGGKARALSLSRGVVAVRAFGLRGTLRACDVGEHVTYAVVDGKGGGQLRVHPGATPELGTSAKVTLPDGAAGLDHVRGGQALTVIWKRGEALVCLVRGPSKLEARIAQLPEAPIDVAIIEGSLLVASPDGKLRLYDETALSAAGDAPLVSTSEVKLEFAGEMQVLLAAATKAGASAWIGTSAGSVLSIALAGARESADAKVDTKAAARKDREASRPAAPPATEVQSKPAKVSAAPSAAERAEGREALKAELARVTTEHEKALVGVEIAAAERLAAREQEFTAQRQEAIAALERELASERAAHLKERAAREAHELDLAARQRATDDERRAFESQTEATLAELGEMREALSSAQQHASALAEVILTRDAEITALKAELTAVTAEFGAAAAELTARALDHERDRRELVAARAARAAKEEELSRVEQEAQELGRTLEMLGEQARGVEAELEARTQDRDALRAELDAREARISSAEEQARARDLELATRTREREDLRGEIDRLTADLTRDRERLDRPSLIGLALDGRLSVKHARDALDAVIQRLQSALFRGPHR
jgi:hypothetical protein